MGFLGGFFGWVFLGGFFIANPDTNEAKLIAETLVGRPAVVIPEVF